MRSNITLEGLMEENYWEWGLVAFIVGFYTCKYFLGG